LASILGAGLRLEGPPSVDATLRGASQSQRLALRLQSELERLAAASG
jgi:hypothetical protein